MRTGKLVQKVRLLLKSLAHITHAMFVGIELSVAEMHEYQLYCYIL